MKKFKVVRTIDGVYIDFARIEKYMHKDLRDNYLRDSDRVFVDEQEFYDAYAAAHWEAYGERFIINLEQTEMATQSNYIMWDLQNMADKELLALHNIFCWGWPKKGNIPGKKIENCEGLSRQSILNRTLNVILYCYFWVWQNEDKKTRLVVMPRWADKIDRKRQYYNTCRLILDMKYYSDSAVEIEADALTRDSTRITYL